MTWFQWDNLNDAQQRQCSEDILKATFNVGWLFFEFNGKNESEYPGEYDPTDRSPHYGNCSRCCCMGTLATPCCECVTNQFVHMFERPHVLMLGEQLYCQPERWYNPQFLHNANRDARLISHEEREHYAVNDLIVKRRFYYPQRVRHKPTMTGPCPIETHNFNLYMETVFKHPQRDELDDADNDALATVHAEQLALLDHHYPPIP